jgi:hypothetical protein
MASTWEAVPWPPPPPAGSPAIVVRRSAMTECPRCGKRSYSTVESVVTGKVHEGITACALGHTWEVATGRLVSTYELSGRPRPEWDDNEA